jgi:hypothetical protein
MRPKYCPKKSEFVCPLNQSHTSEEQNALLTPFSGKQCLVIILELLVCEKELFGVTPTCIYQVVILNLKGFYLLFIAVCRSFVEMW